MSRIELIKDLNDISWTLATRQSALIGTFRPTSSKEEVEERFQEVGNAVAAAQDSLRAIARLLNPTRKEFEDAGVIVEEDGVPVWYGAPIWNP